MILTTSFHGPMNLPWEYIEKMGGKKEEFEKFAKKISTPKWEALELGTLWWIDKQITQFIYKVSEQYPDSLFVITGDHTHYAYTQGVLSHREVPMLIYSPSLKIYPTSNVGSQLDIAPTLLNLSTPKGFVYIVLENLCSQPILANLMKSDFIMPLSLWEIRMEFILKMENILLFHKRTLSKVKMKNICHLSIA